MSAALLLAIGALGSGVTTTSVPIGGPAWVEIGVAIRTELDPASSAGLTAVAAAALDERLRDAPACRGVCRATSTAEGIVIRSGARPEEIEGELARIFAAIARPYQAAAIERAVRRVVGAQVGLRSDDRRLAYHELARLLFAGTAAGSRRLGDVLTVSSISAADVSAFFKRNAVGRRTHVVLAGAVGSDAEDRVRAATAGLAAGVALTSTSSASSSSPGLSVVVVDKPDRQHVEALVGWVLPSTSVEAMDAARVAWGGAGDSPIAKALRDRGAFGAVQLLERRGQYAAVVEITGTPEDLPKALRAALAERRTVAQRGLDEKVWTNASTHLAVERALAERDAETAVDTHVDRWLRERGPSTVPGPDERRAALARLVAPTNLVIVIVASAAPSLLTKLAALPGVDAVSIVAYDNL